MTTAEALLSILGPVSAFFASLGTIAVRRHFRFVDGLEKRLGEYLDTSARLQALVAEEMRLSRLAREAQDEEVADLIRDLEAQLGRKIDDKRMSTIQRALDELRGKRAKGDSDPPTADAEETPVTPPTAAEEKPRRAKTDPRLRPAEAVAPRSALGSRPGR